MGLRGEGFETFSVPIGVIGEVATGDWDDLAMRMRRAELDGRCDQGHGTVSTPAQANIETAQDGMDVVKGLVARLAKHPDVSLDLRIEPSIMTLSLTSSAAQKRMNSIGSTSPSLLDEQRCGPALPQTAAILTTRSQRPGS